MNVPIWIAKRYFLSGKKLSFINLVSIISITVIACVTMSLVIALSVFNGLEDMIRSLYNSFDPEIKIVAVKGKNFTLEPSKLAQIKKIQGITYVTEVIEDNALAKYKDEQIVVKVKGLSNAFIDEHRIDDMIVEGDATFFKNGSDAAIVGQGVKYALSLTLSGSLYPLQLLYPKSTNMSSINPQSLITNEIIMPAGVFAIEKQYDDNYIFVPLSFAQKLFGITAARSYLEIKTDGIVKISKVENELQDLLGDNFTVQNSDEQHASLLRAVRIEKLFMQVTISFIFAIASLNIFFCLTMLAIKKKKDIALLYALGATSNMVKKIFIIEGCMIAFSGAVLGLLAGLGVCLLQIKYGVVSMGMNSSLIDAYPVKLFASDFISVGLTVIVITIIASIRPAIKASQSNIKALI